MLGDEIFARLLPDPFKGWERLFQGIDTNAFHNSASRKETSGRLLRQDEEVLRWTMNWAKDPEVTEHILHVHGSSRTSTIAQAVASLQEQEHVSLATYIVSKKPNNEDVRARFIPTIAYQLGRSFPKLREEIGNIVAHDPAILSLSVSHQLDSLILQPLELFLSVPGVVDNQLHPPLIIIDGCDYLDNYTRTCIINALLRVSQQFPLHVRILLFTKSSARITADHISGIEDGTVAEIDFRREWSLGAIVGQVWSRLKNVASMKIRTRRT